LRIAFTDGMRVVPIALDRGRVTFEFRLGLQWFSPQAFGVPRLDLGHAFGQFAQTDVVFLGEHSCDGQQPASVVGKAEIDGAAQVDVADSASFLGQPDSAPSENLTHDVGAFLPHLVLLVLVFHGRIRFTADVMRSLGVGAEPLVVNEIWRRRFGEFRVGGFEAGHQVQMSHPLQRGRHKSSIPSGDPAMAVP
jgi:hypothetical protein